MVGLGDIDGGALALTFTPAAAPRWLYLPGDDLHAEVALSAWHDAGPDGDVHSAHAGPIWHYEPGFLGPRGFVEWGTSLAWVSDERVERRDLGTRWHFTTHATLGFRLGGRGRWHVAYRIRHSSNAGLARPNPGLDITMLEIGYTPGRERADSMPR
ncbi:MAG: acyloxyacyl hydrolase [Halofilum sp. (in: g-proteobacteria)]|nr:acyloxyacyl hydrolase [Halofilum sp. (in: g-proteobacteria)]